MKILRQVEIVVIFCHFFFAESMLSFGQYDTFYFSSFSLPTYFCFILQCALLLYLFFSLCIILKKTFNVCPRLLYCTFYTCTLHSFFVCASYILMHLFSILFVFCASFLCLFLIAFSLIYRFSFFHFLCIFKSSFLNSLYIFIVFLGLWFFFCTIYLQ